jgi:4-aminobutyrate aminotransferase-like enzyme
MAVLDVIEEENLQKHALETGNWLKEELNRLKKQYPLIGDVRGEGFFLGIELILDPETLQPTGSHAKYVVERLKTKRILMSTEGPGHNVLKFKPPMVFGRNEGKFLLENLESVLQESPIQFVS